MNEPSRRRVELPVLCRFLRCKSAFGDHVDGRGVDPAGSAAEWQRGSIDGSDWRLGESTTEVYWCLSTMEPFGPDDGYVHATVCKTARSCCRTE